MPLKNNMPTGHQQLMKSLSNNVKETVDKLRKEIELKIDLFREW